MKRRIRIGTRGSMLALAQARFLESWLQEHHPGCAVELEIIKTLGDRFVDRPLSTLGGKGVFVKEIEEALDAGRVDCAVHSMKDVPSDLAPGLVIAAIPRREVVHDVLLTTAGHDLESLPAGARIGTSSLRRMALLRAYRPELQIVPLRGNVDTRLRKLDTGELDGIVLAAAGLRRLNVVRAGHVDLPTSKMVPAIGQGALAIETRNDATVALFDGLNHPQTAQAVNAERAFLRRVGGSCRTPLAAYARVDGVGLQLEALIAALDGSEIIRGQRQGAAHEGNGMGESLADELLARGGRRILDELGDEAGDGR